MTFLLETVEILLHDAGFSKDLYELENFGQEVIVEVNNYNAVKYILQIAEEDKYKRVIVGQYEKRGKTHKIIFFSW
jgi:hypothetical protein